MSATVQLAQDLYTGGLNCAQSVLCAFCEKYGLPKETAMQIASGLGGGFRTGEICGAASGAVIVIGLKDGMTNLSDARASGYCGEQTKEFIARFSQRNSYITCRDIIKNAEGERPRQVCIDAIKSAVQLLEEMGY